jgi:hypothetical protein
MKVEIHRTEIYFKLSRVLLLFQQLHLSLSLLLGFSLLEFFLGLTCLSFLLFVVFFLLIVQLLLLLFGDGLGDAIVSEIGQIFLSQWLQRRFISICLLPFHLFCKDGDRVVSVGNRDVQGVLVDTLNLRLFYLHWVQVVHWEFTLSVELVFKFFFKLIEYFIVELGKEHEFTRRKILSWRRK